MAQNLEQSFERAKRAAEGYASDPERASRLLDEAAHKGERHKRAFGNLWSDFVDVLRLLRAWNRGQYRGLRWATILSSLAALIYFVNPFDLLPDIFPIFGYLDDATIVAWVLHSIRNDLDKFRAWEQSVPSAGAAAVSIVKTDPLKAGAS
ncbi:MAG: YkvA family protein [Terriglobales bacterium]